MLNTCNGIAILVWEKNGRIKTLCNGEQHHDVLAKEDEELRLGKIEPYRFELLYPCNVVFDRAWSKLPLASGLCGEQPPEKIFNAAIEVGKPFFMKHTIEQLQFADLIGANLRDADLRDANLRDADLIGADLIGADLNGANLNSANLRGANLRDANLRGANLRGADLRGANLRGANLRGADLRGADLRGANLNGADLNGADLNGADLNGADLRDADLENILTNEFTLMPKI